MNADPGKDEPVRRGPGWAGVALVAACALLAGVLEAFLVPLYAGSVIVPVAVVLSIAGNLAFPRMARALVPTTAASVVPLLAWLAVMLVLLAGRPEGDLAFPGRPLGAEWTFYGTLFGGALAGVLAVVLGTPPPVRRQPRGR